MDGQSGDWFQPGWEWAEKATGPHTHEAPRLIAISKEETASRQRNPLRLGIPGSLDRATSGKDASFLKHRREFGESAPGPVPHNRHIRGTAGEDAAPPT